MARNIYETVRDSRWRTPVRKGYKLGCCDCGLIHRIDFRLVGPRHFRQIQLRYFRDERATGQRRRYLRRKYNKEGV